MVVQFPSSPNVCCSLPGETEQMQHEVTKERKNISKFNHFRYVSALITVYSAVFAVLCSSEFMGLCLQISINSRSDWLKSEAEHYHHCYQRIENASPCLCLHKWPIFRIFYCQQLHNIE